MLARMKGAIRMEVTTLSGFAGTRQLQFIDAMKNNFVSLHHAGFYYYPFAIIHAEVGLHTDGLGGISGIPQEKNFYKIILDN